jgi:hypothetical protein
MKRSEMEHGTRGKRAIFRRSEAELSPAGADEVPRFYDDPVRRLSRKREEQTFCKSADAATCAVNLTPCCFRRPEMRSMTGGNRKPVR